jgi:hypothetical protein
MTNTNVFFDGCSGQHGTPLAYTMSGKLIDPTEALASELIQTKITVSENQRQMRVMARTEVELRDLLEQRERSRERDLAGKHDDFPTNMMIFIFFLTKYFIFFLTKYFFF